MEGKKYLRHSKKSAIVIVPDEKVFELKELFRLNSETGEAIVSVLIAEYMGLCSTPNLNFYNRYP